MLSQQDLKSMLDRLERMSRSGDKDAAKQLLEQLQQMLENLQMAQPGQGGDDMEQALNELGDMIRKQQQLRDKTYKQGQDSRRDRMRGNKQGDQSMGDLQQDQPGDGPGNPRGRQQGAANSTDPLGRPMRNNEFTDDYTVKVPGEIDVQRVRRILEELRRRLADPSRPQIELDYIERLLKDY